MVTAALDPERQLALAYVPAAVRSAIDALWRLDVILGQVLVTGSEPMISRIRLAWWREALERLDRAPPPAEPMLETIAQVLLPAGITGAELGVMETGWTILTGIGALGADDLAAYGAARGGTLFALAGRLLGDETEQLRAAGIRWALVDLARRSGNRDETEAALAAAQAVAGAPGRWPRALRPLGMLAALADRDIALGATEQQGSPARIWRMIRHRLTGR